MNTLLLFLMMASAPPTVRACDLISRVEVETALGRTVAPGRGDAGSCDFNGRSGLVTITVQKLAAAAAPLDLQAEAASLKATFPGARLRKITGVGTEGLFLDLPEAGTQLHIIQGQRFYVLVSVLGFGEAEQVSGAAESVARKVLERL